MTCHAFSCDLPSRALPDDPDGMHPDCAAYEAERQDSRRQPTAVVVHVSPQHVGAAITLARTVPGTSGAVDVRPCPPDLDDAARPLTTLHVHLDGTDDAAAQNALTRVCSPYAPHGWSGTWLVPVPA